MKSLKNQTKTIDELENGILAGNRVVLAQAITLIESHLTSDKQVAEVLIQRILPKTGKATRIGITGAPGVGKSTFIEVLGKYLTSIHKKIAVLAIDPSSKKTKGSILGDKTRMDELSKDPLAFIRPSASSGSLGGVTNSTQETILLCEAAGFDVIIIETVGVGQSETTVREMTDFFLLLMLAGAGDELQGIKKGIIEMADAMVITKADGENVKYARQAQVEFEHAMHLSSATDSKWVQRVLISSALTNMGIDDVWNTIEQYIILTKGNGFFNQQRNKQEILSFHRNIDEIIKQSIADKSKTFLTDLENKIKAKQLSPRQAARLMLDKTLS